MLSLLYLLKKHFWSYLTEYFCKKLLMLLYSIQGMFQIMPNFIILDHIKYTIPRNAAKRKTEKVLYQLVNIHLKVHRMSAQLS